MRLFSAAVPPPEVTEHLSGVLPDMVFRVPEAAWHITVGYYGEEDPAERIPWVRARASGMAAPRVALGEMSNFGETLFMSVTDPSGDLAALGAALRWNDKHPVCTPHLTVGKGAVVPLGYAGPQWTVNEVVLLGAGQRYEYTVLDRVPLR